MRVVIDIEANSLTKPTQIWCIVCKDIDTNALFVFREVTTNEEELNRFKDFHSRVSRWIGHNIIGYDFPVLSRLLGVVFGIAECTDTLIISKLVNYSRVDGHSVESYGVEFGLEKVKFNDFTKWSKELEEYCIRDVAICHLIFNKYRRYSSDPSQIPAIVLEHRFQLVVNQLHNNGFCFDTLRADKILTKVQQELKELDQEILREFPPKLKLVREVTPIVTKHGTLNRKDFRWVQDGNLSDYNGGPFCKCSWIEFNPASHKQIIEVLHQAGWKPIDRTQTHIDTEREINRLKYSKSSTKELDITNLSAKMRLLGKYGWRINENNLATLPSTAPSPAKLLAKRILIESRRRTLTEWLGLVQDDGRIHGKFYGIGAWTHRMAHQQPNTANIPTDTKLYGKEMRKSWCAPKKRLLVGVDAEGIQLRVFAHYIDDKEFTEALVNGRKEDKTDPHSLNSRILDTSGITRDKAKRFIFAYILGGGVGKLAEILGIPRDEGQAALDRLVERYSGLSFLKREVIPIDAQRGYFIGLDGRRVPIPGDTVGQRKHLCMSGYLQNGEAVIMKRACVKWHDLLKDDKALLVNFVHDEWQTETPNDMETALRIAKIQAASLEEVGRDLKLKCPLAGSYWNDENKDYTIGVNWSVTH